MMNNYSIMPHKTMKMIKIAFVILFIIASCIICISNAEQQQDSWNNDLKISSNIRGGTMIRRLDNDDEENNNTTTTSVVRSNDDGIPKIIWFTHKENILESMKETETYDEGEEEEDLTQYYDNVMNTVKKYREAWNEPDAPVNFMGDETCKEKIVIASPDLLPYFEIETDGRRRGDLCRLSILYLEGGYYFDTDVQVIKVYKPDKGISFATTKGCAGGCIYRFSQGFIASKPKHPILRETLKVILDTYTRNLIDPYGRVRPIAFAMGIVYNSHLPKLKDTNKDEIHILQEIQLDFSYEPGYVNNLFPEMKRQYGQGECNIVLHDTNTKEGYFFRNFIGSTKCQRGLIPHRIWFTHNNNVLNDLYPTGVYDNVVHTIRTYRKFWHEPYAPVNFLNNEDCRKVINQTMPDLLPHFDSETSGSYKGDMCRNAAIYNDGGYYFDVDMQVVQPVQPHNDQTIFISSMSCGGGCFFNAFFACTPRNPIVWGSMIKMIETYETGADNLMLGPITMANAYHDLYTFGIDHRDKDEIELLREDKLDISENPILYPNVQRQPDVGNCNWIVHDPKNEIIYFFARFLGYGGCQPEEEEEEKIEQE